MQKRHNSARFLQKLTVENKRLNFLSTSARKMLYNPVSETEQSEALDAQANDKPIPNVQAHALFDNQLKAES